MPEMEPKPVSNDIFGLAEDPGFKELQKMAKNGCEIAENLVEHHKKRPCFRKIDVLCSRLMQDLEKDNYKNVVANINSQGIAWAVKDFIFTFTRIVNAWVIMRGYVYNRLDGLDKIKDAVDPELTKNFLMWQETTSKMVDSLVKSFVSLDQTVQNQRGASSKNLKDQINESFDQEERSFQDSSYFDMSTIEESEEAQRKYDETGTYFKSAIYHPIQKDSPKKNKEADLIRIFNDDLNNSDYCFGQDNETIPDKASFVTSTPKKENPFQVKLNLIEEYDLFGFKKQQGSGDAEIANMDTIKLDTWKKMFGSEAEKIRTIFQEILALKVSESFYCPSISRFCLPNSLNVIPENDVGSVNLNTILYKLQYGRYFGWKDVVLDLHQMVDSVKACLKVSYNNNLGFLNQGNLSKITNSKKLFSRIARTQQSGQPFVVSKLISRKFSQIIVSKVYQSKVLK